VTLVAAAAAAGLPAHAQSAQDWSGFYAGANAGYTFLKEDGETVLFDTNRDGSFGDTVNTSGGVNAFSPGFCDGAANGNSAAGGCTGDDDTGTFGIRAGYDWQTGSWVFGGVADYTYADLSDSVTAFSTTPAAYVFTRELKSLVALRARGGYAMQNFLIYGTGGFAFADVDHSFRTTNTANSFTPSEGDDVNGYQLGAGAEMKLASNWSLGVEYLFTSLDDGDYEVAVGPGTAPATNPFLIVNPTGTDMRRSNDDFEFGAINATLSWRW
jgi:opacity protein-like surface antigen